MTQFAINLGWCAFGAVLTMLLFMWPVQTIVGW
jgi:hypothetical protein